MNNRPLSALVSLALSACAAADTRSIAPNLVVESRRNASDIALCISYAWDRLHAPASIKETKTGYSVYWVNTAHGHVALLADVDRLKDQTVRTTFRKNFALGTAAHEAAVLACQTQ